MTDEIIEKVMQGDSKSEDYEMLKRMFPEFFEVVTKDIEKAINLQQEQTNQNIKKFIEELEYKISQSCYIENQGVNDLFDDIKELTSKYFPQITNHNSLTNPSLDEVSNYQKQQAKYRISKEIKNGKMKRGICESCGCNKNIIGHHKDYSKPLDVNWYCRKCHLKLHNIRSFLKSDANKRISITLSGRKLSEEHKKNISKKRIGKIQNIQTRNKISESLKKFNKKKINDFESGCDKKTKRLLGIK